MLSKLPKEIVKVVLTEKLSMLMEELQTNEFVDMIGDRIHDETGIELNHEQVKRIVGDVLIPLLPKFSDIGLELFKV